MFVAVVVVVVDVVVVVVDADDPHDALDESGLVRGPDCGVDLGVESLVDGARAQHNSNNLPYGSTLLLCSVDDGALAMGRRGGA